MPVPVRRAYERWVGISSSSTCGLRGDFFRSGLRSSAFHPRGVVGLVQVLSPGRLQFVTICTIGTIGDLQLVPY